MWKRSARGEKGGSRPADLNGPDLLSAPSFWLRVAMAGLVAAAAAPVLPLALTLGWTAAWLVASGLEQLVARRSGFAAPTPARAALTFAMSLLSALAAGALIARGEGGARLFAVALMGFSSVNILLRYYSAPRILIATLAPHMAVLGWVAWGLAVKYWAAGQPIRELTPLATVGIYGLLLWPARNRLMAAWKRLEAAKQGAEAASRAKSEFLATMSHEIRTPLNGILGMAHALQTGPLAAEQKASVRVIRGCGETLLAILNDVLDLSKIEAGQLTLERQAFDMEHVTRGAAATFGPLAARKGVEFAFTIDESAKGTFQGDPVRLRQILYNLISNAVKFTDEGAVAVCVEARDGAIVFEVADSGAGIPAEKIASVFDRFVQADGSATRKAGGAGLGLAVCRELVELMGGRVAVDSEPGRGSVFTVTLPLERFAEAGVVETETEALPHAALGPKLRVLAAEDNEVNRLVLSTLLSRSGLDLTVVENGQEALEAWRSEDWDLILMDVQMPVMDGVAATRAIRAAEGRSERPRTPIIAVTANALPEQRAEYEGAGMDAVVPKPLEIRALFGAMERALEGVARAA